LLFVAVLMAIFGLVSGCAGTTSQAEDGARMQIVQEVRSDLRAPPREAPVRMLGLDPERFEDDRGAGGTVDAPTSVIDPQAELAAIELAQEGKLMLLSGNEQAGLDKLQASFSLHPNYDALEAMLPVLLQREHRDSVKAHCASYRPLADAERVEDLLRLCHQADAAGELVPWASDEDRALLRLQLSQ
jgi:hypothetical protein